MSLKERVAYLKGLAEGFGFDSESKEGKLFLSIIDTLSAMAEEIHELGENALDIGEELDAISDDLADVEELLFDSDYDDDDDDDDDDDYDDYFFGDFDNDDFDEDDDECNCAYCSGEDISLEIECPKCGVDIELSESDLANCSATCSSCGEKFELEIDDVEDE